MALNDVTTYKSINRYEGPGLRSVLKQLRNAT